MMELSNLLPQAAAKNEPKKQNSHEFTYVTHFVEWDIEKYRRRPEKQQLSWLDNGLVSIKLLTFYLFKIKSRIFTVIKFLLF